MGDYLERLAATRRDEFDNSEPSNDIWPSIDKELARPRKSRWTQYVWKVAALLFLVSTTALLVERMGQSASTPVAELDEFEQVESYYVQLIESKREQLATYESAGLAESFRNDLDQLDDLYRELKDQFATDIKDPKLKDAMIINLKVRLDILSRQIEILEKISNHEEENELTDFS